jgi:hypothetical protein
LDIIADFLLSQPSPLESLSPLASTNNQQGTDKYRRRAILTLVLLLSSSSDFYANEHSDNSPDSFTVWLWSKFIRALSKNGDHNRDGANNSQNEISSYLISRGVLSWALHRFHAMYQQELLRRIQLQQRRIRQRMYTGANDPSAATVGSTDSQSDDVATVIGVIKEKCLLLELIAAFSKNSLYLVMHSPTVSVCFYERFS